MGTFDHLTVKHALPDGFNPAGVQFQSKDTPEQWLAHYTIRADGTLWKEGGDSGPVDFHGALYFYAGNWGGSCGNLKMTTDDQPPWSADYTALYESGKLIRIDGPGWSLDDLGDVEHVPRADFDRRCAELRASRAKPGDDLHSEWLHWMLGPGESPLEAVKLPALRLRLHYLRGHCAWGSEAIRDRDHVRELRDWADWMAEQSDLPGDVADLLARTKSFLETAAPATDAP